MEKRAPYSTEEQGPPVWHMNMTWGEAHVWAFMRPPTGADGSVQVGWGEQCTGQEEAGTQLLLEDGQQDPVTPYRGEKRG